MHLKVDSLIEINMKVTGSNNINLIKTYVNPYGFDKMHMDKDFIEHKVTE